MTNLPPATPELSGEPAATESSAPPAQAESVPLPSHPGDAMPGGPAGVRGRLRGRADEGCVWLETADGPMAALWWPGYTARFDPVRIYDETGRQVWQEGEEIQLPGGSGGAVLTERIPEACRHGDTAWWMGRLGPA